MNYITEEQFLEQSEKIQLMLLDWWKPQDNDLVSERLLVPKTNDGFYTGDYYRFEADITLFKDKTSGETETIPLFNETQLRGFIEEKTYGEFSFVEAKYYYNNDNDCGYSISSSITSSDRMEYKMNTVNLLEAYWQVACKIAEESE